MAGHSQIIKYFITGNPSATYFGLVRNLGIVRLEIFRKFTTGAFISFMLPLPETVILNVNASFVFTSLGVREALILNLPTAPEKLAGRGEGKGSTCKVREGATMVFFTSTMVLPR